MGLNAAHDATSINVVPEQHPVVTTGDYGAGIWQEHATGCVGLMLLFKGLGLAGGRIHAANGTVDTGDESLIAIGCYGQPQGTGWQRMLVSQC
jgi:hypothetical protein